MVDPGLAPALKLLQPLVSAVGGRVARLKAERAALAGAEAPQLLRDSLQATLRRLRGGRIEDSWWQQLVDDLEHKSIAPDWLRAEAVRAWLGEHEVADALLELAANDLGSVGVSGEDARGQAEASYSAYTGEDRAAARSAVETVVSVLIAGYIASIPKDQRPVVGLLQAALRRLPTEPDPVTRRTHSELAEAELDTLLARRTLAFVESHEEALGLFYRVTTGDLVAADPAIRSRIQYWAALLCAAEEDALDTAKQLRADLPSDSAFDLTIIDARIAEADDDNDTALRTLRDVDSTEGRSALFGALARIYGNRKALSWFEEQHGRERQGFFTPTGWRNWAFAMVKEGRWEEAAERLVPLGPVRATDAGLAQMEGVINAALLLPPDFRSRVLEDVPLYSGIQLHHTPDVARYHARATECFQQLRDQLRDIKHAGFSRYLDWWRLWLRLLSPDADTVQHARAEIADAMENGFRAVSLAPLVWTFHLEFDTGPLMAWLDGRRELGGLNAEERVAEWVAKSQTMSPAEFLAYLADHRAQLEAVIPTATLVILECEGCIGTDQLERARSIAENAKDRLGKGDYGRLLAVIESAGGVDPLARLEAAYNNDKSLQNLKALVAYLHKANDFGRLRVRARELFERERTVANARLVALSEGRAPGASSGASLEFLISIPDLISVDDDLQALKAQALFTDGRFEDAKVLNDVLLQGRSVWQDTELDVYLALHMGEWERLAAILDAEWENRDRHNARTLMQLAHLAAEGGASDERAIGLGRLAVERAGDDARVLVGTYMLHVRLGQEDKVDPSWLSKAAAESAPTGPVRQVSLDALVADVLPKRRAYLDEVTKQLAAGRFPISVAASQLNVPLMSIFVQAADENERVRDGRHRGILPIVSGSRGPVTIKESWTVGLDLTSILLLKRLGLLDRTLDTLGKVMLSPDVFTALFTERHMARFHQPSQIRKAQELETECDSGRIRCFSKKVPANSELSSEVGPQLAALLVEARSLGATVVCDRPIYKVDSLLSREAAIGNLQDLLVSPLELCEDMWQSGKLASDALNKARRLLPNRPWRRERRSGTLDTPIYVDGLALYLLQDARVLGAVTAAGLDVRIHQDVLTDSRRLGRTGAVAEQLVEQVEDIRSTLRAAIQEGKASLLGREEHRSSDADGGVSAWVSTQSLMQGADRCDAVCIDERTFNALGGVSGGTGRTVPIVCTIDVLREMRRRAAISKDEYWTALHKLRCGGFVFVPADAEEVGVRARQAVSDSQVVVETVELRMIRQATARAEIDEMGTPAEMVVISRGMLQTAVMTIRDLWADADVPTEVAARLSDRLWRQLMEMPFGSVGSGSADAVRRRRDWFSVSLGLLLWPVVALSEERRLEYSRWVWNRVEGLQAANAHAIQQIVRSVRTQMEAMEEHRELVGHLFLAQLPYKLRQEVIKENPAFAKACGFETRSVLTVEGGLEIETTTLLSVSREALRCRSVTSTLDVTGRTVEIAPLAVRTGVEIRWTDGETSRSAYMPDLALLASATATRRRALRRLVARVGPTAANVHALVERPATNPLPDEDVALLLRESASGFASIQNQCRQTVRSGRFGVEDIVPDSVAYFEDLVGPPPGVLGTDAYVRGTLVPYRKTLLRRDLRKGLELALLGALRDDLCPGRWLTRYKNDRVCGALDGAQRSSNPFVLLGVLDVALYRREDPRFEKLAVRSLIRLADSQLGRSDGADRYQLLSALSGLVQSRMVLLPGCATHPNYWRLACALMHGGWLLDELEATGVRSDIESFLKWLRENRPTASYYADAAGARTEPMLYVGQLTAASLREEVARRLDLLRARHEKAGRPTSWSDETRAAWKQVQATVRNQLFGSPGPLEGDRRPLRYIPEGILDAAKRAWTDRGEVSLLQILAFFSQGAQPNGEDLEAARDCVRQIGQSPAADGRLPEMAELNFASVVAVACRDLPLADEVAEALVRLSSSTSEPPGVYQIVHLMVQTAAVNEEKESWSKWLEARLESVARALPGPPSRALGAFLESLREMQAVLPCEEWFHLRARAVALSGAA